MPKIKTAGDTWSAQIGEESGDPQLQTIVFFCVTNGQRPYRVVEVPRTRIGGPEALEALSAADLQALFDESISMNFLRT
jgi:hypothetical protein